MSEVRLIEPNRRILIVDDNRSIHEDFEKILGGSAANDRGDLGALEAELFGGVAQSPAKSASSSIRRTKAKRRCTK